MTAQDLCRDAAIELGIVNAVDPLGAEDGAFFLSKLNRIIDNFNAQREAIYATELNAYLITPGLGTHSIGPGGTWVVASRPVKIIAASVADAVMLPTWVIPLNMREVAWWQSVSNPSLTSTLPTDFAYLPEWPLGLCVLWPTPTVANAIVLETAIHLTAYLLTTTFSMPPGYQDAITLTLAEDCAGPFRVPMPQMLPQKAAQARARIYANNDITPRIATWDYGMPGRRR